MTIVVATPEGRCGGMAVLARDHRAICSSNIGCPCAIHRSKRKTKMHTRNQGLFCTSRRWSGQCSVVFGRLLGLLRLVMRLERELCGLENAIVVRRTPIAARMSTCTIALAAARAGAASLICGYIICGWVVASLGERVVREGFEVAAPEVLWGFVTLL